MPWVRTAQLVFAEQMSKTVVGDLRTGESGEEDFTADADVEAVRPSAGTSS